MVTVPSPITTMRGKMPPSSEKRRTCTYFLGFGVRPYIFEILFKFTLVRPDPHP
jgi:hypothetical protein